jgi:hypothetical protein
MAAVRSLGRRSSGRMTVRCQRFLKMDLSAFQGFHTIDEGTVGCRFDAFNIASYDNPDTNIDGLNFGNASLQTLHSTERHLQFSARYTF